MSMVPVVDYYDHTLRIYAADGILLAQKTVHLTAQFGEGLFSKNIHDIQKKQHTYSLNNLKYLSLET